LIVIDACTVISWVLDDEDSASARPALETAARDGALVPGNFLTEIVHALARAQRRGRVDEATGEIALTEILAFPLRTEIPDPHAILSLARLHALTGYDAAYLALALQTQVPLATIDETLRDAARSERCLWAPQP
jgi:predicted nucleic acid-binding protein